jgi:hypothetical protein
MQMDPAADFATLQQRAYPALLRVLESLQTLAKCSNWPSDRPLYEKSLWCLRRRTQADDSACVRVASWKFSSDVTAT